MYKMLLCLRYLRSRYIALASIISVMLGVATMIVVNGVMAGFTSEMQERLHGILADIVVESTSLDGQSNPELYMQKAQEVAGNDIAAMTSTVEIFAIMNFQYAGKWISVPVQLIGIDPASKAQVGPLTEYLENYQDLRGGKDNKEIIRPALYSKDRTPDWELPEYYAQRRRRRIDMELAAYNQLDHILPSERDSNDDNQDFTPNFDEEADNTAVAADETKPENKEPTTITENSSTVEELTHPDDIFGPAVDNTDNDPYELLEGRLYVGKNIVSFTAKDPETGETRTINTLFPGDNVRISTVKVSQPPKEAHMSATVIDYFKSGMSEYDGNIVFCNLEYLQKIRGMINEQTGEKSVTSIQIKLNDPEKSADVIKRLKAIFPPGQWKVRTWQDKQGPLLAAVAIEAAILNVLLFMIIMVAGFGILAIFYMIVVEKTRDIGILKALGASSHGISTIFLSYGLSLGIVGSGVGVIMGLLFVKYINEIEAALTWITGQKIFDDTIYYLPKIPTLVEPMMVIWVAIGAMIIAVLASILPARRAARLHPVQSLRYE